MDEWINQTLEPVAKFLASIVFYAPDLNEALFGGALGQPYHMPLILIWLVLPGLFLTVYFGFINIRCFPRALRLLCEKDNVTDKAPGQISRFQALATTLSATVGLGNIAGVAIAISVGGPGAMVWMILMGVFGMSTKFTEATLGVKHRHVASDGHVSGGAMYYLRAGFDVRGWPVLGKVLGSAFAIFCIGGAIGGGNMFQANQVHEQLVTISGGDIGFFADKGWLSGLILATLCGVVIIGGLKSIARVASAVVPIMGLIYLAAGLVVITAYVEQIPAALNTIWLAAFSMQAGLGAFIGALIQGVQRAAFSNEAGIGSGGIAHAAVKTDQPVSQGLVAMLGPFVDTIVICSVTALVIVLSGAYTQYDGAMSGVALTSEAFASVITWFPYVLALTVFLFAFSTMISWSYYGMKAISYLFDESASAEMVFKIVFCLCCVIGTTAQLDVVLLFCDSLFFAMAIPNVIGLYIFAPDIKRALRAYLSHGK